MFQNFGIKDIIDIVLVAVLMYQLYKLVNKSGTSSAILKGIMAFVVIWILVSYVFQMRLLGTIIDKVADIGLLVLVIIFQDEIRRFLMSVGSHSAIKTIARFFTGKKGSELSDSVITPIVLACMNMAKTYTGALIVIEQEIKLSNIEETGEMIDADVSTRLIENIFFKNTPLHDGAMIIADGRIKAAGCILPVTQRADIPQYMGLRHRAAFAVSQETDAKVIVVSEERGKISFVSGGEIEVNVSPERLQALLTSSLTKSKTKSKHKE
ncbi:diadenylate cyclase CdaA [Dysgonomonas sp. 25]|uniref:diadenylate cyclase CdaA n=1 Tax=Dysgonomonas sp. 25 TaxID=2302933 RepID=UPI0013D2FD22|nr:diadenylate cyclase CdaA [Dysgonomonas sp. 25]NDV70121.1 TIGR00159 family protein [Dysgonomonas sp. 25]